MTKIMLTGLTGYVGGKLAPKLLSEGHTVHALVRDPTKVSLSQNTLKLFPGDARDLSSVSAAMEGCEAAYYLVHGLNDSSFEYQEALAAQTFAEAAQKAGVKKIIYLGALGDDSAQSPHLRSRHLTGKILALGRAKVLEFRASIVIGDGSTSTEILKLLASRLPFFIEPSNLKSHCQPIGLDDLLSYLTESLNLDPKSSQVIEIGGADSLSYVDLLKKIAGHSDLTRKSVPSGEVNLQLIGEAFEFICPEYVTVGRHLIESLTYATVLTTQTAKNLFPTIRPVSTDEALSQTEKVSSDFRALISPKHGTKVLHAWMHRLGVQAF